MLTITNLNGLFQGQHADNTDKSGLDDVEKGRWGRCTNCRRAMHRPLVDMEIADCFSLAQTGHRRAQIELATGEGRWLTP